MWLPLLFVFGPWAILPAERLLLLEDTSGGNFERTLVHQELLTTLMRDPATHVVNDGDQAPHLARAVAMAQEADLWLDRARSHLSALNPEAAVQCANAALTRYRRVAELCGTVTGLSHAHGVRAAAHLLQGHKALGEASLRALLLLDPAFTPSPSLFNSAMKQSVQAARRALGHAPKQSVRLLLHMGVAASDLENLEPSAQVAVFVDGHFTGFGPQTLSVVAAHEHYLWLVPPKGAPQGVLLRPSAADGALPAIIDVALWPTDDEHHPGAAQAPFGHILLASRLKTGEVDPYHPSLAARRIDTVLVLSYGEGALRLTTFELRRGQRRSQSVAAAITNLWDVSTIAHALMQSAPPLAAVPEGVDLNGILRP